ncbi:hypothetical protein L1987_09650 [Smallanthus sonchifolius]|uniref:Uncharacterized protein n=1 Tax=Smallanthus sonchifolius TaxID=185202 RepID=A0ACB9JPY4_9ASTR|nr:hypothetical protein L1987_09650 [Smallanthus sonchifolius]
MSIDFKDNEKPIPVNHNHNHSMDSDLISSHLRRFQLGFDWTGMGSRLKEDERNERAIRNLMKLPENWRCINYNSLVLCLLVSACVYLFLPYCQILYSCDVLLI